MRTVSIMFNTSMAIQGLEVKEYSEDKGWIYLECTDGETMQINKDNVAYIGWKDDDKGQM